MDMVPSAFVYAIIGAGLSACLVTAVIKPDRRRRALRAAGGIAVMGPLFAAYPLVFCLFLVAGPAFLGCDLAVDLPWGQALAKNRGGLVFSAGWGIIGLLAMVMGV